MQEEARRALAAAIAEYTKLGRRVPAELHR